MNDALAHGSEEQSLQSKLKCGKSHADVSSEALFTYQAPSKRHRSRIKLPVKASQTSLVRVTTFQRKT